jgi:hypothetical protein
MRISKRVILGIALMLQFVIFLLVVYLYQAMKVPIHLSLDPVSVLFLSWTLFWIGVVLILQRGG